MELLDFRYIYTRKKLLSFLKEHNVAVKKKPGSLSFETTISDYTFFVVVRTQSETITGYCFYLDPSNLNSYWKTQIFMNISDSLEKTLGKPCLSNTNHFSNNQFLIRYLDRDWQIEFRVREAVGLIFCANMAQSLQRIPSSESVIKSKLALMFLALWWFLNPLFTFTAGTAAGRWRMGISAFIFLALLFTILRELITYRRLYHRELLNKIYGRKKQLHVHTKGRAISGTAHYSSRIPFIRRPVHLYRPAVLEVQDDMCFLYLSRFSSRKIPISFRTICETVWTGPIEFIIKGTTYYFYPNKTDDLMFLKKTLHRKLFCDSRLDKVFNVLRNVTIRYNPYQIYDTADLNALDLTIERLSRTMLNCEDLSEDAAGILVKRVFHGDTYIPEQMTHLYLEAFRGIDFSSHEPSVPFVDFSKVSELLDKYLNGEISKEEFLPMVENMRVCYSTCIGEDTSGDRCVYITVISHEYRFYPVFTCPEEMQDYYEKSCKRAYYIAMEDSFRSYLETVEKENRENHGMRRGVLIRSGSETISIKYESIPQILQIMKEFDEIKKNG